MCFYLSILIYWISSAKEDCRSLVCWLAEAVVHTFPVLHSSMILLASWNGHWWEYLYNGKLEMIEIRAALCMHMCVCVCVCVCVWVCVLIVGFSLFHRVVTLTASLFTLPRSSIVSFPGLDFLALGSNFPSHVVKPY